MNYRYFLAVRKGAELLQCVYFATRTKLRQTAFVAILCNVKFRKIPSYKLQEIAPNCKQVDENCNYCQPIYYICSAIWKL